MLKWTHKDYCCFGYQAIDKLARKKLEQRVKETPIGTEDILLAHNDSKLYISGSWESTAYTHPGLSLFS